MYKEIKTPTQKRLSITSRHRMRSTACWFIESYNSQYTSQFATSFISTRAKTFTAAKNIQLRKSLILEKCKNIQN